MFSANGKCEGDPSGLLHRSGQRLLPNVPATCSVPVALLLKVPASRPRPDTGRVPLPRFCCRTLTRSSPPSLLVGHLCRCQTLFRARNWVLLGQRVWGRVAKSWERPGTESCNFFTWGWGSQDGLPNHTLRNWGSRWKLVRVRPAKTCGIYPKCRLFSKRRQDELCIPR